MREITVNNAGIPQDIPTVVPGAFFRDNGIRTQSNDCGFAMSPQAPCIPRRAAIEDLSKDNPAEWSLGLTFESNPHTDIYQVSKIRCLTLH